MTESLFTVVSAWLLAAIFAVAVRHKIFAWVRFCASLQAYELVPTSLTKVVAGLLIVAELVAIAGLVPVYAFGFALAAVLLTVYLLAILINMLRGRSFIDCGCGDEPTGLSSWLVTRNFILVAVSVTGFFTVANISLGLVVVGLCLAVVAYLLYAALDQMITNHSLHRRLWLEES